MLQIEKTRSIILLYDQNISYRILKNLPEQFKGSTHVKAEGLQDKLDKVIWDYAKEEGFTIVTQDSDFNDLNSLYGFPQKIIWIRTGNLKTLDIRILLSQFYSEFQDFLKNGEYGCFEIIKLKEL